MLLITSNFYFNNNHLIIQITSKEVTKEIHSLLAGICEGKKYSESSNKSDIL